MPESENQIDSYLSSEELTEHDRHMTESAPSRNDEQHRILGEMRKMVTSYDNVPEFADVYPIVTDSTISRELRRNEYLVPKWYKNLVAEVESFCRHVLVTKPDYILIMDKSARMYAPIIHDILPIIKLEYCMVTGGKTEDIDLPKMRFMNPPKRYEKKAGDSDEKFATQFSGSTVMVFDEASYHNPGEQHSPGDLSPADQYRYFEERTHFFTPSQHTSAGELAQKIQDEYPGSKAIYHIGNSIGMTGNLGHLLHALGIDKAIGFDPRISETVSWYVQNSPDSDFIKKRGNQDQINAIHNILRMLSKSIALDILAQNIQDSVQK